MEQTTITALVWFKVYDYMYIYADEAQKEIFDELASNADLLYTPDDDESYQSALEREYEENVRKLPSDVDNTEDARISINTDFIDEMHNGSISEIKVIGPEEVRSALLGDEKDAPFDYSEINMMGNQPMTEEQFHNAAENLPGRIGDKLRGLVGAIDEVNREANEIFGRYIQESEEQGLTEDQAKTEAKSYMQGKIPAAEFIAPVGILDALKDL